MAIPVDYLVYVVRIWPVRNSKGLVWRALITNAQTRETRGLTSLKDLFTYFEAEISRFDQDQPNHKVIRKGGEFEG